ncbi:MAG: Gfo/Idh/MocA family protein, partial [Planctomycetota bacterium]
MERVVDRRTFVKGTAGTALAGGVAPMFIPGTALGLDGSIAPSNRTVIAHIGVGGRGSGLMRNFIGEEIIQTAAVCDVDSQRRDKAAGFVDEHYTKTKPRTDFKGTKTYHDYREMLDDPDVDAVVVAIPDHWHALVTCHAAQAGKDIYCEKPLTLTVAEGRRVVDTVKRLGRVLQVGSHERSRSNARYACELVQNGRIGKLHTIHINMPVTHGPIPPQPKMPVPPHLDWNTWLGPAPWAEYTEKRSHFSFRYILDYSGGEMTDRGAHVMDIAQLGNGTDHTTPVEVEGTGWRPTDGLFNTFMKFDF